MKCYKTQITLPGVVEIQGVSTVLVGVKIFVKIR
jgi:hypothetical protein